MIWEQEWLMWASKPRLGSRRRHGWDQHEKPS